MACKVECGSEDNGNENASCNTHAMTNCYCVQCSCVYCPNMCIHIHKVEIRIDNWSDNMFDIDNLDWLLPKYFWLNWLHKGEFVLTKCGMA